MPPKVHRNNDLTQRVKAAGLPRFLVSVTLECFAEDAGSAERYLEATLLKLIKPTPTILKHLTTVEKL